MAHTLQFVTKYMKCGRGCEKCPHGPYWAVTWKQAGKQKWKYIGLGGITGIFDSGETIQVEEEPSWLLNLRGPDLVNALEHYVRSARSSATSAAPAWTDGGLADALASLDLDDGPELTREKARKRLYTYKRLAGTEPAYYAGKLAAFVLVCRLKGWALPKVAQ